jgi:dimeric dUTPase (all-alpha-NTP-PPase superfamily)
MKTSKDIDLEFLFEKQKELNTRIEPDLYKKMSNPDFRRMWFLNYTLALQQEIGEAIDSTQWKWWKKGEDDWDNIKIELVDMLHFWISMCQVADMDANEVKELYLKKNELNHTRQNKGYKEGTYQKVVDGKEDNEALHQS